jgi:hypothetical protein
MTRKDDAKDFLTRVDSIQSRFMESLITGRRDPIFGEKTEDKKSKSEEDSGKNHEDSQQGTL